MSYLTVRQQSYYIFVCLKSHIYCIVMSYMFVNNHIRNSTLVRLQRSAQKDFL